MDFDPKWLVEHALEFGMQNIINRTDGSELIPQAMIFTLHDDETVGIIVMLLMLEKDLWAPYIHMALEEHGGFGYVLLTEGWVYKSRGDDEEDAAVFAALQHSTLADLEVRKTEVLQAAYSGYGGNLQGIVEIKEGRKAFGEVTFLYPNGGRMNNIGNITDITNAGGAADA